MSRPTVRVAVLSPQPIIGHGVRWLLSAYPDRVRLVGLNADGPEPDVVLYDAIGLLSGDTTDLDILVDKTSSAVLIISRDLRPGLTARALAAGADGHFSVGADGPQILAAVESATTGWQAGDAGDNPTVGSADSASGRGIVGTDRGLTPREADIVALVAQGRSNAEIAAQLYLSVNTVKTYIRGAYRKIGAVNRSQATSWAIEHGVPFRNGE